VTRVFRPLLFGWESALFFDSDKAEVICVIMTEKRVPRRIYPHFRDVVVTSTLYKTTGGRWVLTVEGDTTRAYLLSRRSARDWLLANAPSRDVILAAGVMSRGQLIEA
jgi:hypothetical protein